MNAERQFLYVDGAAGYTVALDQSALRIARFEETARLVPIRRVDRVILRQPRSHTLNALLELVRHGVAVHFQDGEGRIAAALVATEQVASPWAQEWALSLRRHVNVAAYHDWLDMQLRHAAALILRRTPSGLMSRFESRLHAYARRGQVAAEFRDIVEDMDALLHAWLDTELRRQSLVPVIEALHAHDLDACADLRRCLRMGLLWRLGPWLRQHCRHGTAARIDFFERARAQLTPQLMRHVAALEYQLRRAPVEYAAPRRPCTRQSG